LAARLARERISEEDDVLLRSQLVECLGNDGSEASMAILQTQLKTETSDEVKKRIYRALFQEQSVSSENQ